MLGSRRIVTSRFLFCSRSRGLCRDVGHALDVVEGLTVRLQRVHVEMLESFRSAVISQVDAFVNQFAGCGGWRVWRAPSPAKTAVSLDKTASRPSLEALNRSRSALGLSPPVVVDDGPDADEQAVGKTG